MRQRARDRSTSPARWPMRSIGCPQTGSPLAATVSMPASMRRALAAVVRPAIASRAQLGPLHPTQRCRRRTFIRRPTARATSPAAASGSPTTPAMRPTPGASLAPVSTSRSCSVGTPCSPARQGRLGARLDQRSKPDADVRGTARSELHRQRRNTGEELCAHIGRRGAASDQRGSLGNRRLGPVVPLSLK
jgi:hypothetical protein